jgi:hypothetical protein
LYTTGGVAPKSRRSAPAVSAQQGIKLIIPRSVGLSLPFIKHPGTFSSSVFSSSASSSQKVVYVAITSNFRLARGEGVETRVSRQFLS